MSTGAYYSPGSYKVVELTPDETAALSTLSGVWEHASSYLKVNYGIERSRDGRDSIDGWTQEAFDAINVLVRLGARLTQEAASEATRGCEPYCVGGR